MGILRSGKRGRQSHHGFRSQSISRSVPGIRLDERPLPHADQHAILSKESRSVRSELQEFRPAGRDIMAPSAWQGKTVFRAGFGIYHGAAQNDDLNAGLESDRFTLSAN